jgi:hypothetical protein
MSRRAGALAGHLRGLCERPAESGSRRTAANQFMPLLVARRAEQIGGHVKVGEDLVPFQLFLPNDGPSI